MIYEITFTMEHPNAARLKGHRVGGGVNATMSVEVGAVDICAWDNMKIIKNVCI